jgi:hypothetical protein
MGFGWFWVGSGQNLNTKGWFWVEYGHDIMGKGWFWVKYGHEIKLFYQSSLSILDVSVVVWA